MNLKIRCYSADVLCHQNSFDMREKLGQNNYCELIEKIRLEVQAETGVVAVV